MKFFYTLPYFIVLALSPMTMPLMAQEETNEVTNDFVGPTTRYLSTHSMQHIKPYMKTYGVNYEHVKAFNAAIENETSGFFGYHGSNREYRIYQDVIRFGIEEIVGISIKDDFHFLRVPGDPALNVESISQYFANQANEELEQNGANFLDYAKQFVAMNMALYENYYYYEQSSVFGFVKNASRFDYERRLIPFFAMMGVDSAYIHKAFEIGRSKLTNGGILLQFFDHSDYSLVDHQTYISLSTGRPYYQDSLLSHFILNKDQTAFPQFRLLVNNHYTLNPNSTFSIKRYELGSSYSRDSYEKELRKYLQNVPVDPIQRDVYKAELLSLWGSQ